jgi:hypothetical protein
MPTATDKLFRSKWWMPSFCLFLGLLIFGAFAIGGNTGEGLWSLGVMVAVGLMFLLGGRSETLRGIGGPGRDERWAMIDLRATAVAGAVTLLVLIGALLNELAQGKDGDPYGQLLAVSGVGYIAAVAFLRWRS